jgi:PIN domain nuclease of toxin-antitoxin system
MKYRHGLSIDRACIALAGITRSAAGAFDDGWMAVMELLVRQSQQVV